MGLTFPQYKKMIQKNVYLPEELNEKIELFLNESGRKFSPYVVTVLKKNIIKEMEETA